MDSLSRFIKMGFDESSEYRRNDIGIARLFFDMHSNAIRYVIEAKSWYVYDGRRWVKDEGGFKVTEAKV